MDSPCIKQTVCKVLNKFHHGKYLVAYVLKASLTTEGICVETYQIARKVQTAPSRGLLQEQPELSPYVLPLHLHYQYKPAMRFGNRFNTPDWRQLKNNQQTWAKNR